MKRTIIISVFSLLALVGAPLCLYHAVHVDEPYVNVDLSEEIEGFSIVITTKSITEIVLVEVYTLESNQCLWSLSLQQQPPATIRYGSIPANTRQIVPADNKAPAPIKVGDQFRVRVVFLHSANFARSMGSQRFAFEKTDNGYKRL